MQQQRRHVLLDYCVEDGVFGESVRKALEREQWRVFDPSRGKQLDVNTVIARGVQASDVCVLVASKGFVASKRESKLANPVSQKKMPIVWVKPPGQGDVTGWLGVILVDGTQASSAIEVSAKILEVVGTKSGLLKLAMDETIAEVADASDSCLILFLQARKSRLRTATMAISTMSPFHSLACLAMVRSLA